MSAWCCFQCIGMSVSECTHLSVDCLECSENALSALNCLDCPKISICVLGYSGVHISIHLSLHNVDLATYLVEGISASIRLTDTSYCQTTKISCSDISQTMFVEYGLTSHMVMIVSN